MSTKEGPVVICRCCVSECKNYKGLFKEGIILGEVTTLAALLTFCTNLEFDEEQNIASLPRVVCTNCIQDIAKSYVFKKKVLEADEALRSQLLDDEDEPAQRDSHEEFLEFSEIENGITKQIIDNYTTVSNRETPETDLEELAAAAQMKRELDQQMYEENDEYEESQLSVLENDDEEVQIEVEEQEHELHDDEDLEYVVQEVAETTEIYHSTETDHSQSPQHNKVLQEEIEEIEQVEECEEEIEYEIHVNGIDDDYTTETMTSDPVGNGVPTIKTNMKFRENNHDGQTLKGSRSRNRTTNKIPNPNFQCKVCGKQLSNSSSFKYHMQLHSDETPYACDVCDERFKTRNAYDGHKRTHDPNNPNTCDLCGKSYRQPSSLRIHMLSHTGEKPFICNICGKSLTQKSGYKKHMLTHTGEKPYPCDICGKSFRISSNMLAHRRSHAGDKPHSCVECEKSFGTFEQLKRHMLVHSEQKPFTCDTCGKQFKRQSTLRTHAQSHCYITNETTLNFDKKICKSNVVEIM